VLKLEAASKDITSEMMRRTLKAKNWKSIAAAARGGSRCEIKEWK